MPMMAITTSSSTNVNPRAGRRQATIPGTVSIRAPMTILQLEKMIETIRRKMRDVAGHRTTIKANCNTTSAPPHHDPFGRARWEDATGGQTSPMEKTPVPSPKPHPEAYGLMG